MTKTYAEINEKIAAGKAVVLTAEEVIDYVDRRGLEAAAKEVAFAGVRVNAVQPGLIRTAMTLAMPEHVWEEKLAEIPMGRAAEPSEVAQVVLFLASDMSSYMTGTVLEITGGRHI
jgi:3-oxoacyl-[acyl-carrier protein] reductase